MSFPRPRATVLLPLLLGSLAAQPKPPAAEKMLDLFQRLQAAQSRSGINFSLTEREINEYLQYSLRATPRPGLQSVTVKAFPINYLSTYVVIDFDAVETWKPGTIPTLLKPVLNGRKAVWVDVRFKAEQGLGTFSVEKAYFQDIRLPAFLVEKVAQVLAARQPEHYDLGRPVPLPFGLKRVSTRDKVVDGEK